MKNKSITIVIPVYNRPKLLNRLLQSLKKSNYLNDNIKLVISMDKSNNPKIKKIVESFNWFQGDKIIINHNKHLGLREHIIKCGNLTKKYNNIILLEDDLYVDRNFYTYSKQALKYYQGDSNIAGISLYSPGYNETLDLPFFALNGNYDGYFIQLPSSWGQVWSKKQWEDFMKWYEKNQSIDFNGYTIPENIKKWPETSWKKYFSAYMVDKNKYFLYPIKSCTTNFGEIGTHFKNKSVKFQVPLLNNDIKNFRFVDLKESKSIYDIYYENIFLKDYLSKKGFSNLVVDLYGSKKIKSEYQYLLTSKKLNFKIIKSYGLKLKPPELNIFHDIKGEDIFLYNTNVKRDNKYLKKEDRYLTFYQYFYSGLTIKKSIKFILKKIILSFKSAISK